MTHGTTERRGWTSFHGGHSAFVDGRGTVAEIAQAAAERGFVAFGFTEHFTAPPHDAFTPDGQIADRYQQCDWIAQYVEQVRTEQRRWAGTVRVLLGTEIEYVRGADAWTRERLAAWPFDYVVGSVHFLRFDGQDVAIDWDRARAAEALRRAGSPEQLYLDYYDHLLELLDWRLANILGHLDLIKIHLEPSERADTARVRARVRAVLETMRDRSVALDVNARGLIKPCRAIYPADWILGEARRLGVVATLGDDSHGPDDVGARLEHAVAALRRAGYETMGLVQSGGEFDEAPLPEPEPTSRS